MVPTVPLVPDLNVWPILVEAVAATAVVGAVLGALEQLRQNRRQDRQSTGRRTQPVPRVTGSERKAA
jgi:hypothetical protein